MNKIILERAKTSEKIVRLMEAENTMVFIVDRSVKKDEVKKEIENLFGVKVAKVRTHNFENKKYAYVKLKPEFLAVDLATKLGLM